MCICSVFVLNMDINQINIQFLDMSQRPRRVRVEPKIAAARSKSKLVHWITWMWSGSMRPISRLSRTTQETAITPGIKKWRTAAQMWMQVMGA